MMKKSSKVHIKSMLGSQALNVSTKKAIQNKDKII